MPGLNQLKQFSEDIREVGDEVKIRAQRGEKPSELVLPQNISAEDDSDDFIIGLPDNEKPEDISSDGEPAGSSEPTVDVSDIDSLLEPQVSADDDALAEFLSDDLSAPLENTESEKAEEAPALEDMDLEELLKPSESGNEINLNEDIPAEVLDNDGGPRDSSDILQTNSSPDGDSQTAGESSLDSSFVEDASPASGDGNFADLNDALSGLGDLSDLSGMDSLSDSLGSPSSDTAESSLGDLGSFDIDSLIDEAQSSADDGSSVEAEPESVESLSPESPETERAEPGQELEAESLDEAVEKPEDSDFALDESLEGESGESLPAEELGAEKSEEAFLEEADALPADDENLSDAMASMDVSGEFNEGKDSSNDSAIDSLGSFDIDSLIDESANDDSASSGENESDSSDKPLGEIEAFGGDSEEPLGEIPDASMDVPSDGMEETSLETFDTSGMEDVDFGSSPSSSSLSGDEFPSTDEGLSAEDDFVLDSSFEIPGFSDTETADFGKKKSGLDIIDFSKGKEGRPKNSLTDDEYVQFKKNLSNYPLNLRIAIEDFIARDEFTDDAIFEVIEKVLKKTSARQLATQLEKILDISINIPRDFERRSFAEYEAYKQSFQYQLKNRIIPAAIVGIILCFVCFGLFKAGQHFIYKPVMANINYKQGYTLLEANEFPQSEEKFWTAVSYKPVKKWFFQYAFGYREKKQFERAGQMYKNILRYFNHDKIAGLEYSEMELYDRANYERAEEIVRREVLDYHINDADGILLLGDVFLEWAEVDPSKYELAKQEYLDLIQRYGGNNVYLSRMLRYNIRTDKLREVLTYKNMFYISKQDKQNLKNLGASDWRELSGYLLDKLYGSLSKNDEYLRTSIEDVLAMLNLAIKSEPLNPVGHYNLARYFIHNGNTEQAKVELEHSLDLFDDQQVRSKKNVYREINATRVLGELYAASREYLKAQTLYTRGINLYNEEHEASELEGDVNTGKLFADMGDLDYFISGELDDALFNYERAIEIKNDTPSINYRVGSIYYGKKDYDNALLSFIKVSEKEPRDPNVLLSLGNVLSLKGDNFAAESYYSDLLRELDKGRERQKVLLPQSDQDDYETVDLYLKVNNNLGVTLHRLAQQTGNSNMNAEAMVRLSDSIRAWDALTRNQQTMIRMEGSNLAAQNSKYITHPYPDFEPAIYTDIPRLLSGEKGLE